MHRLEAHFDSLLVEFRITISTFHVLRVLWLKDYDFANIMPIFVSIPNLEVLKLHQIKGDETGGQTIVKGMPRPVFSLREVSVRFTELTQDGWSWLLLVYNDANQTINLGRSRNRIIPLAEVEWRDVANALSHHNSITLLKFSGNDKLWKRILPNIASQNLKTMEFRFTARGCKELEVALLNTRWVPSLETITVEGVPHNDISAQILSLELSLGAVCDSRGVELTWTTELGEFR
ncbi:hypothetical protein M422DRAFT_253720 [Sphaerobolus stellatus SS14]|uniref:Uncharacterized protein n=1 Tax=Sphaerobolus stellatus (strain SS14) TaxID=990650 RepID=A0A0C9UIV2_SPHS4|nr:hypothetical protein M422DRAFT_253720 [Sphaerobolus stellatus SS14]